MGCNPGLEPVRILSSNPGYFLLILSMISGSLNMPFFLLLNSLNFFKASMIGPLLDMSSKPTSNIFDPG